MVTTLGLLTAIKTCDWYRYDGDPYDDNTFYATAGTTGPDAIDLRCALTAERLPSLIEYRYVGTDDWLTTGFTAIMRYDASREHETDGEGYEFVPYYVTELASTTL